jgi:hypothetical protein
VRSWVKITGCVLIIGFLGADFGLQTARVFAPQTSSVVQQQQTVDSERRTEAEKSPDYLAISTLLVLVFQAWIFYRQSLIMRRQADIAESQRELMSGQLSAATIAARAASDQIILARNQFNASHRPRLVIHSIHTLAPNETKALHGQPLRAEFAIVNAGTGSCEVEGSAVYLMHLRPTDNLHLPALQPNGIIPPRRFDVGATDNSIIVETDRGGWDRQFPLEMVIPNGKRPEFLTLCGWVAYSEASGSVRTTYFRRQHDDATDSFVASTRPDDEQTY